MSPVRCVLADDHPALVVALSDFLVESGVDLVGVAPNGEKALELVERELPDVAVVDYRMPRLAGPELIAQILDVSADTKVVVYTADADEGVVTSALEAGATGLVLKEAPLVDVLRAVESAALGNRYLDPGLAGIALSVGRGPVRLTDREREVLHLLADGLQHDEIGRELGISGETVRTHVQKACERLGASTRTQAVATALRHGLIA